MTFEDLIKYSRSGSSWKNKPKNNYINSIAVFQYQLPFLILLRRSNQKDHSTETERNPFQQYIGFLSPILHYLFYIILYIGLINLSHSTLLCLFIVTPSEKNQNQPHFKFSSLFFFYIITHLLNLKCNFRFWESTKHTTIERNTHF